MTKMQLKVTVVTFATPQLEKIPRLTAFPPFLQNSSTLQQFFHPLLRGIYGKVFPSPHSKEGRGRVELCKYMDIRCFEGTGWRDAIL